MATQAEKKSTALAFLKGTLLVVVIGSFLVSCAHDRVKFTNPSPTGVVGILLDASVDGSAENDKKYITAANGHVDPGDVIEVTSLMAKDRCGADLMTS